jgi:hypothetical protein
MEMGRKSFPFVEESSLLRLRLCDALDDHAELMIVGADVDDGGAFGVMTSSEPGARADATLEDLYRRNRDRAHLVGLLYMHRACQDAQIIVVTNVGQTAEREDLDEDDAMSWFVKPIEQDRLVHAALQLVH